MNKRPQQLSDKIAAISDENDKRIIDALEKIEGDIKLKTTITSVAKIALIHPNTARNRPWVKSRLEVIKNKRKQSHGSNSTDNSKNNNMPIEDILRTRIKSLLDQNSILYQETIAAHAIIDKKDKELKVLNRRLKMKNNN